jgi:ferrous iron transport protein B
LATILVAPLMSCSARLPVYSLLIAAFFTEGYAFWVPGFVLFAMYMVGFTVAPLVALLLKRTVLKGATPVFVMELPAYKRPMLRSIVRRMWDSGSAFVKRAGTIILATMIVMWALLYFPNADAEGKKYEDRIAEAETIEPAEDAAAKKNAITAEWKRNSALGRIGVALEPAFEPLGWDWKIGTAALASFPAREVIVGTLGLLYEVDDPGEENVAVQEAVKKDWDADPIRGKYGLPVALSIMVFFALCMQCASTLVVIQRETKSWAWPVFTFTYMTALAYVGAMATFQIGKLIVG